MTLINTDLHCKNVLQKRIFVISTGAMLCIAEWRNLFKTDSSTRLRLARNDVFNRALSKDDKEGYNGCYYGTAEQ